MSARSITILVATAFVILTLVVLFLVPAPPGNAELVQGLVARLEGALAPLLAATAHTMFVDHKEAKEDE